MLTSVLDPLLSLLYPPRCAVCRTLGTASVLCDACTATLTAVAEPFCARCGQTVTPAGCRHCTQRQPAFTCARALGGYVGTLRDAIHRFKYHDRPALAEPLGILLARYARTQSAVLNDLRFDAVLPVPMHPARQRLRGYNQAERLAQVVARELSLPLDTIALTRARHTHAQVGLGAKARRANLADAFVVRHPARVSGKIVLLIDDVMTTSSTLHSCALKLKAAGAKAVYGLTLAAG